MSLRKPIFEYTIAELDRELIIRGAKLPDSDRFNFKDPTPYPLRDEV